MDKNVENLLNSEKSLLNLGLVLSKTVKITTQRYYDFVCFFTCLRKFVCHIRGRTKAEGVKRRVLRKVFGPKKRDVT